MERQQKLAAERAAGFASAGAGTAIPCYGNGTSGNRVQAVYVSATDQPDRYPQIAPLIPAWASAADDVFHLSAQENGGTRHLRFVHDAQCNLDIRSVRISPAALADFGLMIDALEAAGYNRADRKYLVFADSVEYCGIADLWGDDRPGQDNVHNGYVDGFARVDRGCWGLTGQSIEAHELMHNLGGVQQSAPHSTPGFHCWDQGDRMCYDDGTLLDVVPNLSLLVLCALTHSNRFDCNHDDYFHAGTPSPGSYLATHWNTANSTFLATTAPEPPASMLANGRFTPVDPARLLNTRNGIGAVGPIGSGQAIDLTVAGAGGVPATGVSAVVLNVTATQPTGSSWLISHATGTTPPNTAALTWAAGQTVSNLVVAKVGTGGKASLLNALGTVHLIVDVFGWYSDGTGTQPSGGLYGPLDPARLLNTRNGIGGISTAIGPGQTVELPVTGVGGVPATGVGAVVLNVTATQPTGSSWLTSFPTGGAVPNTAALTYVPGQTVSNLVVAKVGTGGKTSLRNASGTVHLIVDVFGWYSDGTGTQPSGGLYGPLDPARLLNTRNGIGGISTAIGPGQTVELPVTGVGGVPATGVGAVVLNVTATQPTGSSWLTSFPTGGAVPNTAVLTYVPGQTVSNLVVAKVGTGGKTSLRNASGTVHLIVDVFGWYSG